MANSSSEYKDDGEQDLWKQIVDKVPFRVYAKSVEDDLRLVLCNQTICEFLGVDASQILGHRMQEFFPPDVADRYDARAREMLAMGHDGYTAEDIERLPDGTVAEIRTMEKLVTSPDGRRYVFGYSADVTEENAVMRIEQTIGEIASLPIEGGDFLQEVFNIVSRDDRLDVLELLWQMRDGTERRSIRSPTDEAERVVYLASNADFDAFWSYHRARLDMEGIAVYTNLRAESLPGVSAEFRKTCHQCLAVLPLTTRAAGIVGEVVLFFRTRRVFSPRQVELLRLLGRTLSIARNRIVAHHELERQLARAEEAERAKSYFFASVSHDIRTPLNSIIGFSELLKASSIDEETRKRYVEAIASSGQVLLQLVNDVLDLAKLEAGKMVFYPEKSDFTRIVQEITLALLPQAQTKSLQIKTDIEPNLPFVEIDRQRIRQVLFNLVGNAVKFTDRGFVQIAAEFRPNSSLSGIGEFRFGVIDTGRGISADDQKRLMQPFVQLSRTDQGHGTGLGLAICRQLVERMGGTLEIESQVGVGSVFRVKLPRVRFTREVPEEWNLTQTQRIRLVSDPRSYARLRFLLVDDMDLNLQVLKNMFVRLGVKDLVIAHSGMEALAALEKATAPFDAVLTDMWMPEMGGGELVRRLRGDMRFMTLPVFAVTADVEILKTHQELGFTGLLLKPITLKALQDFLNHFLRTN